MAKPSGGTNHAAALTLMNNQMFLPTNGDRWWACNVAIVLTDGYGWPDPTAAAAACKGLPNNIDIYAIGTVFSSKREQIVYCKYLYVCNTIGVISRLRLWKVLWM